MILLYKYAKAQSALLSAIEILATFPGDLRTRLKGAFSDLDSISEINLPDELKNDWRLIMKQLTKCGPKFDCHGRICMGSVEHTMSKIRNSTASTIAANIFKLFYELNFNEKYI